MVDLVTMATKKLFLYLLKTSGFSLLPDNTPPVKSEPYGTSLRSLYDSNNKELHCGIYVWSNRKLWNAWEIIVLLTLKIPRTKKEAYRKGKGKVKDSMDAKREWNRQRKLRQAVNSWSRCSSLRKVPLGREWIFTFQQMSYYSCVSSNEKTESMVDDCSQIHLKKPDLLSSLLSTQMQGESTWSSSTSAQPPAKMVPLMFRHWVTELWLKE